MNNLLIELFTSPAAETEAEPWATRFCAHQGLAALVMLVLVAALGVELALIISLAAYAIWETGQGLTVRTAPLWWDCALDWCAWALTSWGIAWLLWGQPWAASGCGLASLAVLTVGVWRRAG
ncbi:MAG: hypothetical protein Q4G24_06995 [Paracoccus sp. (in: a-proteobacteria)]|uniref:hypothetical protein n=1 Tax=Paracoccus sp. TaxID=267 RepID=UPI0026DEC4E5|nr:hypothetical protein [Paracoccus sp. (in: a-proteobacteria)]MDO5621200.1 hypothetical protein [Paracoccus sp. (in: a-proteobacteria)]